MQVGEKVSADTFFWNTLRSPSYSNCCAVEVATFNKFTLLGHTFHQTMKFAKFIHFRNEVRGGETSGLYKRGGGDLH